MIIIYGDIYIYLFIIFIYILLYIYFFFFEIIDEYCNIEIGHSGGYEGSSRCKSRGCGSTGTIFYRTVCSFAWTTLGTIFRSFDPLNERDLSFFFFFF